MAATGAREGSRFRQGNAGGVARRSAGFDDVDLSAADRLGIRVVRVPAYSPRAVAEHAVALILALNRKTHRAYNRVREGNFAIGALLGFDLHGKTVGVVGTGAIGRVFAQIMHGFGWRSSRATPPPTRRACDWASSTSPSSSSGVANLVPAPGRR